MTPTDDDTTTDDATTTLLPLDRIIESIPAIAEGTSEIDGETLEESIEALTDEDRNTLLCEIDQQVCVWGTTSKYSEPGHPEPDQPFIFFGDWWIRPNGKLAESPIVEVIQWAGGHIQWHDEWTVCPECRGAVRTSADSYGWKRAYVEWEGEIRCDDCMEDPDERAEFIGDMLEENSNTALTLDWDLEELGYIELDGDFQHGLYGGQSADPHKIARALEDRGICRFFFKIDTTGQFDVRFSCWIHKDGSDNLPIGVIHRVAGYSWDNEERLEDDEGAPVVFRGWEAYQTALKDPDGPLSGLSRHWPVVLLLDLDADGPDPAAMLKKAFAASDEAIARMPDGPGIKYVNLNLDDGSATAQLVSPEDFVAGRMNGEG
jgi:hypothetical protein